MKRKTRVLGVKGLTLLTMFAFLPLAAAEDRSEPETCFLAVPFVRGGTFVVKLKNDWKVARDVLIERYSASGKILDSVLKNVAARTTEEVRLDVSSATLPGQFATVPSEQSVQQFGWIRVVEKAKRPAVLISADEELLEGNELITLPDKLAVFPHPLSKEAVRSAFQYSIHHRYTYDVFALRGVAYFFVNLSDHPVQVGMCQANYPDCTSPTLPYTLAPLAMIAFPIDQTKQYVVLESTPGFSAATVLSWSPGLTKIFGASSSIIFGPAVK